jgi:hypothetical protein
MFKYANIFILLLLLVFVSCGNLDKVDNRSPLEVVLASEKPNIKRVMDSLQNHALQIKFTQIERKNGNISFKDFDFQVDPNSYFYPARTVQI